MPIKLGSVFQEPFVDFKQRLNALTDEELSAFYNLLLGFNAASKLGVSPEITFVGLDLHAIDAEMLERALLKE